MAHYSCLAPFGHLGNTQINEKGRAEVTNVLSL
jgi:hypothetical protein